MLTQVETIFISSSDRWQLGEKAEFNHSLSMYGGTVTFKWI